MKKMEKRELTIRFRETIQRKRPRNSKDEQYLSFDSTEIFLSMLSHGDARRR